MVIGEESTTTYIFFMCVGVLPAYIVYVRVLDPPDLELQTVVSCMWMLGTEPSSSEIATRALNY